MSCLSEARHEEEKAAVKTSNGSSHSMHNLMAKADQARPAAVQAPQSEAVLILKWFVIVGAWNFSGAV
eukprot:6359238-Amphidinium_carterae.1